MDAPYSAASLTSGGVSTSPTRSAEMIPASAPSAPITATGNSLDSVAGNLKLNLLTEYLYDLAGAYMTFYESCPVLTADTPQRRASRLRLCDLTARTLKLGLGLLGIRVLERM